MTIEVKNKPAVTQDNGVSLSSRKAPGIARLRRETTSERTTELRVSKAIGHGQAEEENPRLRLRVLRTEPDSESTLRTEVARIGRYAPGSGMDETNVIPRARMQKLREQGQFPSGHTKFVNKAAA